MPQRGFRASQSRRPCQISKCDSIVHCSDGKSRIKACEEVLRGQDAAMIRAASDALVQRMATAEQRWFTDWYPWRVFNVGGAVFYDMGRTWDQTTTGPRLGLLRDWGFGLRLGNSRSAIGSVVHFDLAFPLDGDASIKKVQFLVEAKRSF